MTTYVDQSIPSDDDADEEDDDGNQDTVGLVTYTTKTMCIR